MNDDRLDDDTMSARLLAEDRLRSSEGPGAAALEAPELLARLLDHEMETERRIRQVAVWSWCAVVALVPLVGLMYYLSRTDIELLAEAAGPAMGVAAILAAIALFLALLVTAAWLFRARTMSLAAIERRLAALETQLRRDR